MRVILENGKAVNVSDKEVWNLMKKYNLSHDEAVTLWLEDNEYVENEVVNELVEKSKKNKVNHEAKALNSEKKERKAREKKENPLKKEIISIIYKALFTELNDIHSILVPNDEKYVDLTIGDRNFTINLVEHRKRESD